MQSPQQTIIFLHIPKTGGTTLGGVIRRQYPPDTTYHQGAPRGEQYDALVNMPDQEKARLRLIHGHMGFGLHRHLPLPATYFTLLRDPVARVVSYYDYIRRTPEHNHHARVAGGNLSLREYVQGQISWEGIDNGQVRLLSGAEDAGSTIPFGACTPELLEQAKANLREHFSVVGLMERFDESLILIRRAFGWRLPFYARENVNPNVGRSKRIDPETRALIASHTTYAQALYDETRERFEHEIRRQPASFRVELRAFRILNAAYGRAYRSGLRPMKHRLSTWLPSRSSR